MPKIEIIEHKSGETWAFSDNLKGTARQVQADASDISKVQEAVTTHLRDRESGPKSALGNLRGCRPLFEQAERLVSVGNRDPKEKVSSQWGPLTRRGYGRMRRSFSMAHSAASSGNCQEFWSVFSSSEAPLTDKGVETEAVTSEMKLTIHRKFQDFPPQRFAEVLEYITALAVDLLQDCTCGLHSWTYSHQMPPDAIRKLLTGKRLKRTLKVHCCEAPRLVACWLPAPLGYTEATP